MRVGGAGCAQGAGVLRCEYWLDAANERAWLIADASAVSHDPSTTAFESGCAASMAGTPAGAPPAALIDLLTETSPRSGQAIWPAI